MVNNLHSFVVRWSLRPTSSDPFRPSDSWRLDPILGLQTVSWWLFAHKPPFLMRALLFVVSSSPQIEKYQNDKASRQSHEPCFPLNLRASPNDHGISLQDILGSLLRGCPAPFGGVQCGVSYLEPLSKIFIWDWIVFTTLTFTIVTCQPTGPNGTTLTRRI